MSISAKERRNIYDKIFSFMLDMGLRSLPTPLEAICRRLSIDLVPLSKILKDTGFKQKEIFDIWQNENGILMPYKKADGSYKFKIAFNDSSAHSERRTFTIAEEISHMILEHYKHDMYSIYNHDSWDDDVYNNHEECARAGAGILICPPPVFYYVDALVDLKEMRNLCDISQPCAEVRREVLQRYREEIIKNPLYAPLLYEYQPFINSLPRLNAASSKDFLNSISFAFGERTTNSRWTL